MNDRDQSGPLLPSAFGPQLFEPVGQARDRGIEDKRCLVHASLDQQTERDPKLERRIIRT